MDEDKIEDTFFLDRTTALTVAKQRNYFTVKGTAVKKLQTCYHPFEKEKNDPDNLISVTFENMEAFFTNENYRPPTKINYINSDLANNLKAQNKINEAMKTLTQFKNKCIDPKLIQEMRMLKSYKFTGKPERIRVSMHANTYTTVTQYSLIGLANAFKRLDCEVQLITEKDDLEVHTAMSVYSKFANFKPHIIININNQNSEFISDDIFNVTWWQDPTPDLVHNNLLPWRKRDFIFYIAKSIDINNNLPEKAEFQSFCIDDNIFKLDNKVKRKNKIVFIGSSYITFKPNKKAIQQLFKYEEIEQNFLTGNLKISIDHIKKTLFKLKDQPRLRNGLLNELLNYSLNYFVRDYSVKWACEQSIIPVEIYGRNWNYDPVINKYFKGEVKHGEDIAKIYQSAKYALVCLPHGVNTQRLAEVVACGCIPIVYDCREWTETPHWNQHLLFYKTKSDLIKQIGKTPPKNPQNIAEYFYYDNFAKKILEKVIAQQPNLYYG